MASKKGEKKENNEGRRAKEAGRKGSMGKIRKIGGEVVTEKPERARWKIAVRKCDVLVAVGIPMQSGKQINIKKAFLFYISAPFKEVGPRGPAEQFLPPLDIALRACRLSFPFASKLQKQPETEPAGAAVGAVGAEKIKETCRKLQQTIKMHSCALTLRYL